MSPLKLPIVYVVWVAGFTLLGIVTFKLGKHPRFDRIVQWFDWLDDLRRGRPWLPPRPPDKEELEYHAQTGVFRASLMLAVLFFMLAAVGVIAMIVS